jgi:hypothetical protein
MHLIENKYETAGLLKLPPNARDVAEHLLAVVPLDELLKMQKDSEPDQSLLQRFNAPEALWSQIISATILAKTTYFYINPMFSKDETIYLMKIACNSIERPLSVYSVREVIDMSAEDYPIFTRWLSKLATHLKQIK